MHGFCVRIRRVQFFQQGDMKQTYSSSPCSCYLTLLLPHKLSLSARALSKPPPSLPFLLPPLLSPSLPLGLRRLGVGEGGGVLTSISKCPRVNVCACLGACARARLPVSLSLPPGRKGATQQPACDWAAERGGGGVLDLTPGDVFQQMVEVRECHHIGEGIRGERLFFQELCGPLCASKSPHAATLSPPSETPTDPRARERGETR